MSEPDASASRRVDILITLVFFIVGIAAFVTALEFPGRAGVWPQFVTGLFCGLIAIHLVRLWRGQGA